MTAPVSFDRAAIIGIGGIGGSLALCLKREGMAGHIVGCARKPETVARAQELGLVDSGTTDPAEAVRGADLVVISVPMGAYAGVGTAIADALEPGAIVTDVGSVKATAIAALAPLLPDRVHFVPGHPIAGTENSGPDAAIAEVFDGRWCVLTPDAACDPDAVARVRAMWEACGMEVAVMEAGHHDMVLAITSHLPHLIAYTIVDTAHELEDELQSDVIRFAAAGFRDFTRIAASDPTMWRDIFVDNRDAVLEVIARFDEDMTKFRRAIRRSDGDTLFDLFARARKVRRALEAAKQE